MAIATLAPDIFSPAVADLLTSTEYERESLGEVVNLSDGHGAQCQSLSLHGASGATCPSRVAAFAVGCRMQGRDRTILVVDWVSARHQQLTGLNPPVMMMPHEHPMKESTMAVAQGDLRLLNDPIAHELLHSTIPARLAYTWSDGTPRVVPIWFHWTGEEVVMVSPSDAPKVAALQTNPDVALTIDSESWPPKVLLIRGSAQVELVDGVAPEYGAAARRYFGEEQGAAWTEQVTQMLPRTARIAVRPEWVGILDFQTRFPEALAKRMT